MTFQEVLEKHFSFRGSVESDNLPVLVTGRRREERMRERGRPALARVMADMEFREGVEIGTRNGDSAALWCSANPQLHLTCIDPYRAYQANRSQRWHDAAYAKATEVLSQYGVTMLRKCSMDVVSRVKDGSLDFVFIDGDHRFDPCVQDIVRWVPKVRKGGVVAVHDYFNFHRSGVVQAVDGYTSSHAISPWFVTRDMEPTAFWQRGAERVE